MRQETSLRTNSTRWVTVDDRIAVSIEEFPDNEVTREFVAVSVHPQEGAQQRDIQVGGPYYKSYGITVGHAAIFLTAAEFDDLRNKVIESMVEDGKLTDLTAEAEAQVVG